MSVNPSESCGAKRKSIADCNCLIFISINSRPDLTQLNVHPTGDLHLATSKDLKIAALDRHSLPSLLHADVSPIRTALEDWTIGDDTH